MENPWGNIILGGLAALGTWNSLGPEGKRKAIEILEATLITVEQAAIALGQQRQQLALPPVPELEPEPAPTPPPPPPQWLEEAMRQAIWSRHRSGVSPALKRRQSGSGN